MPEREVKLNAPDDFDLPELGEPENGITAEPAPARRYITTYWDTDDVRLARWGVSLRHRDDEGWTVKLAKETERDGALLVRDEHVFEGTPNQVPDAAAALVRPYVRASELVVVARTRTVRAPVVLRDSDGNQLAEVVDDQVSLLQGRKVAGGYRELEVELGPAAREDTLDKVLDRLTNAGAEISTDQPSKYRRALGARAPEGRELAEVELGSDPTIGELLRADLTASALRLFDHLPVAYLDEEPEGVHQARVAIRRLRSTLRTCRSELDEAWTAGLRDELKWLAGLLGHIRDADVMAPELADKLDALPEADREPGKRLLRVLSAQRAVARQELLEGLASERTADLLDAVVAAAKAPVLTGDPDRRAAKVLSPLVFATYRKLRKAVKKAGKNPADHELHRIRIKAKRCRYAAEMAVPALGRPSVKLGAAAEAIQDELGDQHDAVVAQDWLRAATGQGRRDTAFAAGQLVAAYRTDADAHRAAWRPLVKALKVGKKLPS
jgi:CHAD domain-containing protein